MQVAAHQHHFQPEGEGARCTITDHIQTASVGAKITTDGVAALGGQI